MGTENSSSCETFAGVLLVLYSETEISAAEILLNEIPQFRETRCKVSSPLRKCWILVREELEDQDGGNFQQSNCDHHPHDEGFPLKVSRKEDIDGADLSQDHRRKKFTNTTKSRGTPWWEKTPKSAPEVGRDNTCKDSRHDCASMSSRVISNCDYGTPSSMYKPVQRPLRDAWQDSELTDELYERILSPIWLNGQKVRRSEIETWQGETNDDDFEGIKTWKRQTVMSESN